ncbi:protein acetyltransferase, partial [Proteus mirabilis]
LQAIVQDTSPIRNPLNLGDDTTVERYIMAVNCLLDSHDHDALLLIHTPSAIAPSIETAQKVIEAINTHPRRKWLTLFTNWGGEYSSQQSRKLF